MEDKDYILEVLNLKEYFPIDKNLFGKPSRYIKAVDDVSFKLEKGKTIGVVGESGCGKTTLGRTILQLYEQTDGKTIYNGKTIEEYFPKYLVKDIKLLYSNFKKIKNLNKQLKTTTNLENIKILNEKIHELKLNTATFSGAFILADDVKIIHDLLLKNILIQHKNYFLKQKLKKIENSLELDKTFIKKKLALLKKKKENLNNKIIKNEEKSQLFKDNLRKYKNSIIKNEEYFELENLRIKGIDLARLTKKELTPLRTEIQLIFQDPYSSLPPRMTVGNIIKEAVVVHNIVPKSMVSEHVSSIMKECGLQPQYYDRYPHEFSGGQRQRICIARALAVNPKLVICDEPVSALDVSIQAQIINLLKDLQNNFGLTYVFISHDLSVVKYITDKILVMYLGNVMELGDTSDIFNNPLHPYTKALFSAVPVADPDIKMDRIILSGDIPSPANPPKGCKFNTRCSECLSVCKLKTPKYLEVSNNHFVRCHLYDKAIMSNLDIYDKELEKQNEITEELLNKKNRKTKKNEKE